MNKFRKFLALSGSERITFLLAVVLLPILYVDLRLNGFERVLARAGKPRPGSTSINMDPLAYAEQTAAIVNTAARLILRREACLERSILLWRLLRRKGIDSDLRIGVTKESAILQAHAWVEMDSVPINDPADLEERFTSFDVSFTAGK